MAVRLILYELKRLTNLRDWREKADYAPSEDCDFEDMAKQAITTAKSVFSTILQMP